MSKVRREQTGSTRYVASTHYLADEYLLTFRATHFPYGLTSMSDESSVPRPRQATRRRSTSRLAMAADRQSFSRRRSSTRSRSLPASPPSALRSTLVLASRPPEGSCSG